MLTNESLIRILPIMGCAIVISLALTAALFQGLLYLRSQEKRFHGWGALLSLVTALFTLTSLIQYNQPPDNWVHISEKIQYSTFPLIAYFLFGFSYRFFNQPFRRINVYLAMGTVFLLFAVWIPGLVLSNTISIKDIQIVSTYYREPEPAPLGIVFILICYIATLCTNIIWFKHLKHDKGRTIPYLIGFAIWTVTAFHDGLATFGMPTYIYLMSYGVLGFNIAVIWATTEDYLGLKKTLENHNLDLEKLVAQRTDDLEQTNRELQQSITALNRTQKELVRSDLFLNEMGNTARIGGWEVDVPTRAIRWTTETYHIHGIALDETPVFEELIHFFHPADRPKMTRGIERAVKYGESFDLEIGFTSRTGKNLWTHTICKPVVKNGKTIKLMGTIQDISERRRGTIERQKLENQLRQAHKMQSIGTLAGGIAHDFNNILSSIIGFTELAINEAEKDSSLRGYLDDVYISGNRAKELVKQILTFARQSEEERKPIQIRPIVKEVLKFIRSSLPTNIDIQQQITSDAVIMGNATQIHQIFMNLCTNAAHAMEKDGGTLTVALQDVAARNGNPALGVALAPGNYVQAIVSDTGTGMDASILSKIFDPYFTTKETGKGTGMGLAVVHGIIEGCGGKITVRSELAKGSVFTFFIPTTKQLQTQKAGQSEILPTGTERILVVDDEAPIARMNSIILERLGYRVSTRTSSLEALALFREKPNDFDLIITDMTMPNMTGDQLSIEMRAIRNDIRVIISTGYSATYSEQSAKAAGIDAFIYKPIAIANLAKTLRQVLDAQQA